MKSRPSAVPMTIFKHPLALMLVSVNKKWEGREDPPEYRKFKDGFHVG